MLAASFALERWRGALQGPEAQARNFSSPPLSRLLS